MPTWMAQRLEDIELRRNDEAFLDGLGAQRIPDPTTSGDFTRRFGQDSILTLMEAINAVRLRVWEKQPEDFIWLTGLAMLSAMKDVYPGSIERLSYYAHVPVRSRCAATPILR